MFIMKMSKQQFLWKFVRLDLGLDTVRKFILEGGTRDLNDALVTTTLYKTIFGQLHPYKFSQCKLQC